MKAMLKLLAAGTSIAAIALVVVAVGPTGEVAESQADIVDFTFFESTPSARFAAALEQLGHEEPRAYRIGQETVYFSARPSDRPADRLAEEYQRAFVQHGVNSALRLEPTMPVAPEARVMLQGEIVTFSAREDFFSMGGGVLDGLPESPEQLKAAIEANREKPFEGVFKGFRHVEARRRDGRTIVTAAWSDDDFNVQDAVATGPADPDVPVCPGCVARPSVETLANDVDRTIHHFESTQSGPAVMRFYHRALVDRGWKTSGGPVGSTPDLLEFARDTDRLTVLVQPTEPGTTVTIVESD